MTRIFVGTNIQQIENDCEKLKLNEKIAANRNLLFAETKTTTTSNKGV